MTAEAQPPALPETSPWQQVRTLLWREHVLGLITYVASVPDRAGNALLGLTLFVSALLWSTRDGVLPRAGLPSGSGALIEALLLYVGAVLVANVLRLALAQATERLHQLGQRVLVLWECELGKREALHARP